MSDQLVTYDLEDMTCVLDTGETLPITNLFVRGREVENRFDPRIDAFVAGPTPDGQWLAQKIDPDTPDLVLH